MKDRKKPRGTKARVQAYKKRLTYIGHAITVAILVFIIAVSSFFLCSMLQSPSAAIVDHLSLSCPNQTFIKTATDNLEHAGYTVDYYSGEQVTVEFYRNLPTHGYGLILLRVHSAVAEGTTRLSLFTSELYNEMQYVYERMTGQISIVADLPYQEGDPLYFGIDYKFVEKSMTGRFQNTIIIMMGCDGLTYTTMAEAFREKGARACVSWNGPVLPSHTDQATISLLNCLVWEKQTIRQSLENTIKKVGPDPSSRAILLAYPEEAWEGTIPSK